VADTDDHSGGSVDSSGSCCSFEIAVGLL